MFKAPAPQTLVASVRSTAPRREWIYTTPQAPTSPAMSGAEERNRGGIIIFIPSGHYFLSHQVTASWKCFSDGFSWGDEFKRHRIWLSRVSDVFPGWGRCGAGGVLQSPVQQLRGRLPAGSFRRRWLPGPASRDWLSGDEQWGEREQELAGRGLIIIEGDISVHCITRPGLQSSKEENNQICRD